MTLYILYILFIYFIHIGGIKRITAPSNPALKGSLYIYTREAYTTRYTIYIYEIYLLGISIYHIYNKYILI